MLVYYDYYDSTATWGRDHKAMVSVSAGPSVSLCQEQGALLRAGSWPGLGPEVCLGRDGQL